MHDTDRHLADYCEWLADRSRRPCYAPASLVLVRPNGETLRFTWTEHVPAWATRIHGQYLVLERHEREVRSGSSRAPGAGRITSR